jgi:hypothetical protein
MSDSERSWLELKIGITSEEAVVFLRQLAEDPELYAELERNPRETLLEWNIELAEGSAPEKVKLPPPEAIARHAEALAAASPFGNGHGGGTHPHGFYVLYVVHGNGVPPPSPPGSDAS